MRRVVWPLVAGAIALWLLLAAPEAPAPVTGTSLPPMPAAGRPVALVALADGFAVGGQGGGVEVFDGAGRPVDRWIAHGGAVRRLLEVDGELVSVGDGSMARWSLSGERRWRRRLQEHTLNDGARAPGVAGAVFVGAERGSVARLGEAPWHRRGRHGRATFAVVAALGGIVSGGADGSVVRWSLDGDERVRWKATEGWVTALAAVEGGLVVGDSEGRVTRWALEAGDTPVVRWRHGLGAEAIVGLAADAAGIVAGGEAGSAFVIPSGQGPVRLDIDGEAPLSAVALRGGRAYAVAPDRRLGAWDVTNGRRVDTLHLARVDDAHGEAP